MGQELKYHPRHSLGQLELGIRDDEQWWGSMTAIEAVSDHTLVEYDDRQPAVNSLVLLPMTGTTAPPGPNGAKLICTGSGYVSGTAISLAAYRLP